ncbi:GIN domain-containing protein [Bacteroides sp.]|uniref:GIN domain-containing protein n=1 Tax=Bacteroides sp. TaxID=29523 RepID=UPI003AB374F6
MRALVITLSLLFAAVAGTVYAANGDAKVSEVRKVSAFSSVEITSVATVYFTQSDTYSLKIEGKEKYVTITSTEVKGDRLVIGFKNGDKQSRNRNDGVTIYLSAPSLKEVEFSGVGSFNCEKPLKLDDVKFEVEGVGKLNIADLTCNNLRVELEGVGKANIHVHCDYLSASLDGVGHVTLSGEAGRADISKGGIGGVNTSDLKVGR